MNRIIRMTRDKVQKIYGFQNPKMRVMLDERIQFLAKSFEEFEYRINPYHIQPGLIMDVDITSIKRKKFTLSGMANVLNEFLHGVSKGFQDAAFASFSRRRSTVRTDITQSFSDEIRAEVPEHVSYSAALMAESEAPKSSNGSARVKEKANVTPSRKGKSDLDDLKEL